MLTGADPAVLTAAMVRVPGVGEGRLRTLRDAYGTLEAAVVAASSGGTPPPGFSGERFRRLPGVLDMAAAEREVSRARRSGVEVLCWDDARYPSPLWLTDAPPPPLLYLQGSLPPALGEPAWRVRAAAVVGTRRPTGKGLSLARELGRCLAELEVVVVSGLALGIDGAAHEGALEGAGPTVAVLGGGHAHLHPPSHRALARRILGAGGAILSEHPPDVEPRPHLFPPRNRIISGLSRLVVIVEAGVRSGTNGTARYAREQHREVFACPGRLGDPSVAGTLRLIRDGAHPVTELEDVLWRFRTRRRGTGASPPGAGGAAAATPRSGGSSGGAGAPSARASGAEAALLDALYAAEEATLDELVAALARPTAGARDGRRSPRGAPQRPADRGEAVDVAALTARLTRLELRGAVVRTPTGRFRLPAHERARRADRQALAEAESGRAG